jgi:hypothetical protein
MFGWGQLHAKLPIACGSGIIFSRMNGTYSHKLV